MNSKGGGAEIERNKDPMAESEIEIEVSATPAMVDPVLSNFELPLRVTVHPLGFSIEIASNSQEVIDCANESWGNSEQVFPEPAVQLRIGVLPGGSGDRLPIPVSRAMEHLMVTIADTENFVVCDLRQGFGFGWITQAALADRAYFRYYLLEAAGWTLLKSMYLTPLHAAIVTLEGRGVLLCGDAGAGKSSLAFACARSGWTFLSDDSGCLIRNRGDRLVVGNPHQMRFREAGIELFPELKNQPLAPRPTGELSIELSTESMPEIATALSGTVDYIVFLNRREPDPPCLTPFPKEIALPWFENVICYGEKNVREAQAASLRRLLGVPIYEMHYRDLGWAVNRLEELVREGV